MVDHVGPLATNIEDIALSLTVLAGYDGLDPRMGPESPLRDKVQRYHEELAAFGGLWRPTRAAEAPIWEQAIAACWAHHRVISDRRHVRRGCRDCSICCNQVLHGPGGRGVGGIHSNAHSRRHHLDSCSAQPNGISRLWGRATDMLTHDMPHLSPIWPSNQEFYNVLSKHNPAVVLTILGETLMTDAMPLSAQRKAHRHVLELRAAYDDALHHFDVLVTPTTPTVAPPLPDMEDHPEPDPTAPSSVERMLRLAAGSTNNTSPFNATGHPGLSVLCGWAASAHGGYKLPVGMQIVGRRLDDLGVLKAAKMFELGGGKLGPRPA
uniref:Amidase domain-containing protein n=1 Tax=Bionectria ochroleuca TaxID=29856 RepID=A0A8H7N088_BIOOC